VWMWLATTGQKRFDFHLACVSHILTLSVGVGECMNTFIGHAGPATCGNFTPDGKLILTASEDATLRVWNPKTAQPKHIIQGTVSSRQVEKESLIVLLCDRSLSWVMCGVCKDLASMTRELFVWPCTMKSLLC